MPDYGDLFALTLEPLDLEAVDYDMLLKTSDPDALSFQRGSIFQQKDLTVDPRMIRLKGSIVEMLDQL